MYQYCFHWLFSISWQSDAEVQACCVFFQTDCEVAMPHVLFSTETEELVLKQLNLHLPEVHTGTAGVARVADGQSEGRKGVVPSPSGMLSVPRPSLKVSSRRQ